jgi:hypothetical protein
MARCLSPPPTSAPVLYQLRVVLRGVSPLIWRRRLVRSDSTIAADLHAALQLFCRPVCASMQAGSTPSCPATY